MNYKFSFALAIPSLGLIDRYLGLGFVPLYVVIVVGVVWLVQRYESTLLGLLTERQAQGVLVALWVVVVVCFVLVYPMANSGRFGGGSDRDEALNVAVDELLAGRYPYYARTYLDNPITPMPGALLLATPFVLLGNSAYQTVVWLGLLIGTIWRWSGSARRTLLLVGLLMGLCPAVMYEVVTGSDLLVNSVYVLLFTLLLHWSNGRSVGWQIAGAVLLGVGLASRANFVLIVPVLFAHLWRQFGKHSAIFQIGTALLVMAGFVGGFYLFDPAGFSPLHTASELSMFNPVVPLANVWIPVLTGGLAVGLMRWGGGFGRFFRHATLILAFPILCGLAIMVAVGSFRLMFSLFGVVFVCWRVLGVAINE